MKANSISALSFHSPGHFSIHFIVSKRNFFYFFRLFLFFRCFIFFFFGRSYVFYSNFSGRIICSDHVFFLLHSTKTHNGSTMCFRLIHTPKKHGFFFSYRILYIYSLWSDSFLFSSYFALRFLRFVFPFLSIFIFKFVCLLWLGLLCSVVILYALKCIYDDQNFYCIYFHKRQNAF